tara:strand:+ start:1598 stop:1786 length:189 start_codon:yes stop_codon:yes gene_type:complete
MEDLNTTEVEMVAELRKHVVKQWERLDRVNPVAVMKEAEMALELETIIRSLDDILKPHAKFV